MLGIVIGEGIIFDAELLFNGLPAAVPPKIVSVLGLGRVRKNGWCRSTVK